jgi:hypothetical protein
MRIHSEAAGGIMQVKLEYNSENLCSQLSTTTTTVDRDHGKLRVIYSLFHSDFFHFRMGMVNLSLSSLESVVCANELLFDTLWVF